MPPQKASASANVAPRAFCFVFVIGVSIPYERILEWYTVCMLTRYVQRNLTWIDCVSPTPDEVRSLMHEFGIDPLIAEELAMPSFKSKVERRGETLYVILPFPTLRGAHQHPEQEVDFILGKHFLITAAPLLT